MRKQRRGRAKQASATAQAPIPGLLSSEAPRAPFPIVGIGASAGGLDAFRALLGALPADTGMAFVLVQHLDPRHESILAELLAGATSMPVSEVQADIEVARNHVYVIPPDRGLVLGDGLLELVPRTPPGEPHLPIDAFFRTLAEVQGSRAIGVVLSGTGSDGTLGLLAIAAAGGIAMAQDPATAKSDEMPRSAIAAGDIDFVLPPGGIAAELARLGRHPYLTSGAEDTASAPREALEEANRERLGEILSILRRVTGTDFGAYKRATLSRRVARRMAVSHVETLAAYARHLEDNPAEALALHEDCLISVTSFFRDPAVFEALSASILPRLLERRADGAPLRVWVAGCATGEEAYSIAMCLLERASSIGRSPPLQIFATDLSERALALARSGRYPESIASAVSAERLRRFFTKSGNHYQIDKALREMCVFARHDLTRDPPYSRIDLVSCRNVLIYLEARAQEALLATFHYALRPDGVLLLGPAETPGAGSSLFAPTDEKHRFYARRASQGLPRVPSVAHAHARAAGSLRNEPRALAASPSDVPREADRLILARLAPAGVVVDEDLRVLEFRGDTDPFLEHSQGRASLSLLHLLRPGLLVEVRKLIAEARESDAMARRGGLRVRHHGRFESIGVEVIPIKGRVAAERCLLILFSLEADGAPRPEAPPAPADTAPGSQDEEIARLGRGLAQTTEYVHALQREHEVALEELQSTNEEALSSNEEMQSVNEELQTAKEEIQSANEELATLNQELQERNADLARGNEEIQAALEGANALIDTVRQPLLILDAELRIERANAAFCELSGEPPVRLLGVELARICDGRWDLPELMGQLEGILQKNLRIDRMEIELTLSVAGPRTLWVAARRVRLGHAAGERILLSIDDRTELRRTDREREALLAATNEARRRAEASDLLKDQFVATVSHELRGPLNVISGWMNILLGAGPTPDPTVLTRALAAIGRSVTAQGRLLSDLLDHSRVAAGGMELQRGPVDLLQVARGAIDGVRASAEDKDVRLELSGDRAESVVIGDADRLQQVLWNLIFNAVKFTPRGGVVRIVVARAGNHATVVVKDTGKGIPTPFLPFVFDRFRQAEGSSSRSQPGLGLGLTLVRELVELHGGTVRAESDGEGKGSTFTVVLPMAALLSPPVELDLRTPPGGVSLRSAGMGRDRLAGIRLLVVDDEPDAREAIAGLLEGRGATVRRAGSVAEALEAVEAERPDVLVSDLGMPGEDGYELIRRIREMPGEAQGALPALAVSGYATGGHRARSLTEGFHGHLEKPVAPEALVNAVADLVSRAPDASAD